jgi:hypothetical protein
MAGLAGGHPESVGVWGGDPSRARRDLATLEALLRWAPAVIVATGAAGVGLGLVGVSRDGTEVRLIGAAIVLGSVVLALLGAIGALVTRVAVARWHESLPPPHVNGTAGLGDTDPGPIGETDVSTE